MTTDTHSGLRPFRFEKPDGPAKKKVVKLARTDRMIAMVQVIRSGGENNLHSHPNLDGFWFVLKGRVRFYGDDDVVVGEYGPYEGVLVPRTIPYWFESVGEEELELLQVEAFNVPLKTAEALAADRVNHRERSEHNRGAKDLLIIDAKPVDAV